MDWQYIIIGIIVAAALGITVYRLIRHLRNPLRHCEGCASACSGCALEQLKKEIDSKKGKK
jgi:uncharacterized membrane protein